MPRESENYRDNLAIVEKRAERLFPDDIVFSPKQIAKILNCSVATIYRKGYRGGMTCADIARVLCKN